MTSLAGQTVLVLGGSAGVGLATARLARAKGAELILTTRSPERLYAVGRELGARIAAFDVSDVERLERFFAALDAPVDHVLLTGAGPACATLGDFDLDAARRAVDAHLLIPALVAREAIGRIAAGGTLLFVAGAGARRVLPGISLLGALAAALPALTRHLALELAPIRVNLIAAGLVDTPAHQLERLFDVRRERLRDTLPIGRAVESADVAALAVHLMTNRAVTGATFDIDGGRQLV
jgi:NAD(P)-dependent dehydrogenase (short-subunit alcohol dehydrogenase family)